MINNYAKWTQEDEATLISLRAEGLSYEEVSKKMGRTAKAVKLREQLLKKLSTVATSDDKVIICDVTKKPKTLGDFTFQEIINYLYKSGFRIEENKLVRYTKTPVRIEDIVKNL